MKRLCLLLAILFCGGCAAATAEPQSAIDTLACEAAIATMIDAPQPAPEPEPPEPPDIGSSPAAGELFGGPLDTIRDAKELIRKGNDLADRGKALLDAAERDGKITIDVRLPDRPQRAQNCEFGQCTHTTPPDQPDTNRTATDCPNGRCWPTAATDTVTGFRLRPFIGRRR